MTELQYHLSMNMKANRKKLNYSQSELAERIGTAPNYISLIEQGKKFPSPQMIERIASALQIHSTELFSQKYLTNGYLDQLQEEILINVKNTINTAFGKIKH